MKKNKYATLPTDKVVGDKIRRAREERKVPQAILAEELEMSPTTLRKIENGEKSPTLAQLNAIADLLEVDADTLVCTKADEKVQKAIEQLEYNLHLLKIVAGYK